MKKLICILSILMSISCTSHKNYDKKEQIIISGKVLNFNPDNPNVHLSVNRLGFRSIQIIEHLDSLGNFRASFYSYIPTDVWIYYKTNFLVLTYPGDSIYVEFDGKSDKRPELLKSIKFSGNADKQNQNAAKFQLMYFSNPIYYDRDAKEKAAKELDTTEYVTYLDSMQTIRNNLFNQFITEVKPDEETKIWAKAFLDKDYYDALSSYPYKHQRANKLKETEWSVPVTFYEPFKNRLPISESLYISGYALSSFINRYHYNFVLVQVFEELKSIRSKTNIISTEDSRRIFDSLYVYGIIKYTPDTLLKQMVLTELFSQNFDKSDIKLFENFKDVAESYIKRPFLKEPLFERYRKIKERLENPQVSPDAKLIKSTDFSAKQIMSNIKDSNKGKVIYLDCWATWCIPCKSEMPNSIKLMKSMEGKDVAFVYLCLDSEEKIWKASLAELKLGGEQYFLNKKQSKDFRNTFKVYGIPHYFLIDKKGEIIEKGSNLRPNLVTEKINKLLN